MTTLNSDQWRVLSTQLDEALALSEEERSSWLSALHGKDPDLARELEQLLHEHDLLREEDFLEKRSVPLPSSPGLAGQTLGVYTLLSPIGQGGMGTVWLAQRNDGRFERQVAVKFLNLALMGKAGLDRFKREGRILGRLAHPHIAELIDAGVSETAQPYLVLEYVEGQHIDVYCDQRKLNVEARVRLVLKVLDAVAHAHANLVVHRDINSANVLVKDAGQVKLLDFGIAKLLSDEGGTGEQPVLTAGGVRPMTPASAAPEQLQGGTVTTATDVYALGVLLYLLLTGQHPAGTGPHSPAALIKAIVESEPIRPSDAVVDATANEATARGNAARRSTTTEKLRRTLRGDLDTIIGKALKKEPNERYASVTALADDLRRYLSNQPIGARPETIAYRAVKFIRRNRTVVALTTLAALGTAAGITGTLIQSRTARAQRDFAFHQLSRTQATLEFNEFLLSDAAPSGKPFTVNELLGRAENIVARQRTPDDAYRVELMVNIGDQYSTQDENGKARRILENAYRVSRGLHEHTARAEASCALGDALAYDGDLPRAEALIQEGLRELPDKPQYSVDKIFCLRRGSEVAQVAGDSKLGVARMEMAQEASKHSPFASDMQNLHIAIEMAEAYRVAGQNQQASVAFERAAALLSPLGRDDTATAVVLFNDWAAAMDRLGRPLEAEKLYRRAIDISRAGKSDDTVSPTILSNYAGTLRQLDRLDQAAEYVERAYVKAQRAGDPAVIYQTLQIGSLVCIERHDFARAATMLRELEPRLRRTFPPDGFWFGALASDQSLLASAKGDSSVALPLADHAVAILEAASKSGRMGSDYLPIVLLRRSTVELAAGLPSQAADDANRALTLFQAAVPPSTFSSHVGHAYLNLGRALQAQGKTEEARTAFQSAVEHLQSALGPDHPDTRGARQLAHMDAPHT